MPNDPRSPTPESGADPGRAGFRLLVAGNPAAAADAFARAVAADPDLVGGYTGLALARDELAPSAGDATTGDVRREARRRARGRSRRDRQHVAIIELVLDGRLSRASALAREHLAEFPDDELVLHAVTRRSHDLDDLVTPPEGV